MTTCPSHIASRLIKALRALREPQDMGDGMSKPPKTQKPPAWHELEAACRP